MDINKTIEEIGLLSNDAIAFFSAQSGMPDFGLNEKSVAWADQYIETIRAEAKEYKLESMVRVFGAFLGEALIAVAGGSWQWDEQQNLLGVNFSNKLFIFPFVKVEKQFVNGRDAGDSIAGLYSVVKGFKSSGRI